ncbi:MAG: hypothetical protein HYZ37_12595 [Candidatus Solibacter usitatus]|nr:hypothetical protein [Candidatus Solibacter usitatus]
MDLGLGETKKLLRLFQVPDGVRLLRVGVFVDPSGVPRWVEALVAVLKELAEIDVRLIHCSPSTEPTPKEPSWLMRQLHVASREKFDAFSLTATAPSHSFGAPCDLAIWLASTRDQHLDAKRLATHGALSVEFGAQTGPFPYWDEIATRSPISAVKVYWHESSLSHGRRIRRGETPTVQSLYFTKNAAEPVVAAIRMLAALCIDVQRDRAGCEESFRKFPVKPLLRNPPRIPSSWEAGMFAAGKLARSAALRWEALTWNPHWFLAIRPNAGQTLADGSLAGFQEIPLAKGSAMMADPFLLDRGEKTWMFYEDIPRDSPRGRLMCAEIHADGSLSDAGIVLQRDCHLSYPCVIENNGDVFLLPESFEGSDVNLYRFTRFPYEVRLVASPIVGLGLADATPLLHDGLWYFFAATAPPFQETLLFTAAKLDGSWKLHPASPISSSVANCRPAGNLFWRNGRLFRPAQDCSIRYGYAMVLNEVTLLTPTEFEERPVRHIAPTWAPRLAGTHTWNESSRFQVTDGLRLR